MTMFIQASARATYGIQVQTTDKPAILRMELIGIRIRQLCLRNGFCPLFHRLRRIQCIIQIHAAIIPQSQVFHLQLFPGKMEQSIIPLRSMVVPPVGGNHHILRVLRQPHQFQICAVYLASVRVKILRILPYDHRLRLRILQPIDAGSNVDRHRVFHSCSV